MEKKSGRFSRRLGLVTEQPCRKRLKEALREVGHVVRQRLMGKARVGAREIPVYVDEWIISLRFSSDASQELRTPLTALRAVG